MNSKIHKVPLLLLPLDGIQDMDVRRKLKRADKILRNQKHLPYPLIEREFINLNVHRKPGVIKKLEHPLSSIAVARMRDGVSELYQRDKFLHEREVYFKFASEISKAISNHSLPDFIDVLSLIATAVNRTPSAIRKSSIFTVADDHGYSWKYPDAIHVTSVLGNILEYMHLSHIPLVERTAVLHVAIASIHPFHDGNGRLARIVWNASLNLIKPTQVYIPLSEFMRLSARGYTIRSRLLYIRGDWTDVIDFFCNTIFAYERLHRRALRRRSPVQHEGEDDKMLFSPRVGP